MDDVYDWTLKVYRLFSTLNVPTEQIEIEAHTEHSTEYFTDTYMRSESYRNTGNKTSRINYYLYP